MGERRTLGRFVCGERVANGPVGALHRGRVFGDAGFEKDFSLLVVDETIGQDRAALGRLVRAANGWARLNYPRIAHAHELSVEGDTYFLVSDWLRAATTGVLLAEGPLPLEAALLVAADVADAVGHAHGRHDLQPGGILHLGISPESVLVDGDGNVLVRDFGLLTARVAPGWAEDDRLVYALRYCAPELLEAGSMIDQRADVFAVGALLFELLAGRPAFGGVHARGVAAQIEMSPPSLTGIPPAAGPLLARALEGRAGARLRSLGELRQQALALVGDRVAQARQILAERARRRLPSELPRTSPLDSAVADAATQAPNAIRAPSIADDFFQSLPDGSFVPAGSALPPPPSMLPSPVKWGGRPLIAPATASVWDPPSTTATTTLENLRRKRAPRLWLRAVVPVALAVTAFGAGYVWQRVEHARKRMAAAADKAQTPPPVPSTLLTKVTSMPPGAQLFVDGEPRGATPQALALAPGEHRVVVASDGLALWRGLVDAGASIGAQLAPARLPPTIEGDAGLKLVCKSPGLWRVFVDGVDTGRTCPVEERIPLVPGAHHLTLYAAQGDRTLEIERPTIVKDRGASTRIILEEE